MTAKSRTPRIILPPASGQCGFTLLEIVLALFVFAVVMTIIAMTMGRSMELVHRTEGQAELYSMARTTLLRIQDDLQAIPLLPLPTEPEAGTLPRRQFILTDQPATSAERDSDTLQFLALTDLPAKGQGPANLRHPAMITYETTKASDKTLTLWRTTTPLGSGPQAPTGERAVLCELLTGIDFRVTDPDGQERPEWDSDADPTAPLPRRLTITLHFADPTVAAGHSRFMTSFLLPLGASR